MKVFITGGTGYLGSVLVQHLLGAGHDVLALARSDDSERVLAEAGVRTVRGSLQDTDLLRDSAHTADAVIHAAVDYSATEEAVATELSAVAALVDGAAQARTAKPVLYTSTGIVYGFDATDTSEDAVLPEVSAQPFKTAAEKIVLGNPDITGTAIRASLIFGRGGTKLVTGLVRAAQANGAATYIGEGSTVWYPIHVDDLADLYLRALSTPAPGAFNASGDVPFSFKELAEAIGSVTGAPVVSVPFAVAEQKMGPGVRLMTTSSRLPTAKARSTFGWKPGEESLLEEVRAGRYPATGPA